MATAKKSTTSKIKEAKAMATSKKVARDADYVNIADYKVQGTRTAIRGRMAADRAKTAGRAKNVESKLKKAAATKAAVKKASSPAKTSARSHQGDLAQIAGSTAARNKAAAMRKAKNTFGIMDQTGAAKSKAIAKTLKSFK